MVESRSALGHELSYRGILAQRRHQLDLSIAHAQEGGFEPFLLIGRAMHELRAKRAAVEPDRFVQVGDRDPHVMNPLEHCQ